ncbi:hypothetical protein A0U92_13640 [Acetobacter aceti]|uniref:Uncharacterized protein n=1 Tax=Acetobacter aceti TaxID=435 RepID=A0A1U9KIM8_ACEAC|nr:hypothetical protein A0U92_13640 [Acetobacter aceti]
MQERKIIFAAKRKFRGQSLHESRDAHMTSGGLPLISVYLLFFQMRQGMVSEKTIPFSVNVWVSAF